MGSGFQLDESHAVMGSDGRRVRRVERVQDTYRVRLVGKLHDLAARRPAQCPGLGARGRVPVDRLAAEDEGDDQAGHVLVHASQDRRGRDLDSGLFEHFALKGVGDRLPGLQHSAGRFPVAVVPPLDQQGAALIVDDDPGDAHGVRALCAHVPRSPLAG